MLKEIVHKNYDNIIELQCIQDGKPVQLDGVLTRVVLDFENVNIHSIDSQVVGYGPDMPFDWSTGNGIIKLRLGEYIGAIDIPSDKYRVRLILYDAINTNGVVWDDSPWILDIRGETTTGEAQPGTVVEVSEDYTMTITDRVLLVNATAGPININLLSAIGIEGKEINIKKIDISENPVIINPYMDETIDGNTTAELSLQYESITAVSDGINWYIV